MIRKIIVISVSLTSLVVLLLGWEKERFLYRVLSALVNDGISVNEEIAHPIDRSSAHQVFWRGDIESAGLRESSGLAASTRREGLLWSINDSGSDPEIFALSDSGADLGKWSVKGVELNDWEGMDSFLFDGRHYLLIGDTGDNLRSRKEVSFLVLEEPSLEEADRDITVSWQTSFTFPDGPKDVEAVAVDLQGKLAIFLNKRELPLRLYSVPLFPVTGKIVANKMAELVPVPRYRTDLEDLYGNAARYLGLPTGMDLFGERLLVTTYRNAYLYNYSALDKPPQEIFLPFIEQREAITFGFDSGEFAYVSHERGNGTQVADIFEIRFSHQSN
mgnify:CR=1 FL=1